jgi:hypothetical protein
MDSLVNKILEAARSESATPHDRHQALIRAGLIAQAYIGADSGLIEQVFGSTADLVLKDNGVNDDGSHSSRSH